MFGSRPRISRIRPYSSEVRLCSATASGVIIALRPGRSTPRERFDGGLEHPASGIVSEEPLGTPVGMRHEADHVALPVGEARDPVRRAVRVRGVDDMAQRVAVTERNLSLP